MRSNVFEFQFAMIRVWEIYESEHVNEKYIFESHYESFANT